MIKLLDYYYLVLIRGFSDRLDYRATGLMAFTFVINLFSLAILIDHRILDKDIFWICWVISGWVVYAILNIIYNKKRRERIKEKYKNESSDSRYHGVVKVVLYEILSVAFLIFAIWWTIGR